MYGIDVLVNEHKYVLTFNQLIRKICGEILEGKEVNIRLLRECIDFARTYIDKHHHGKEEKILFRFMTDELGDIAQKLIRNGMLVEHDLGRLYLRELENAVDRYEQSAEVEDKIDIVANAVGYGSLLKRHAEKEDEVVYTFAERMLEESSKKMVDMQTKEFEEAAEKQGVQEKYILWLNSHI